MTLTMLVPQALETRQTAPGEAVLALDVGGTRIRAAVVGVDGRILARSDGRTPAGEGPAPVIETCIAHLRAVRDEILRLGPRRVPAVTGIGLCAPGPLDTVTGFLVEPPNFGPGFVNVPFAGPIGDALGLPAVLERDTHVAALGELAFGAARGARNFLYLTVSTGFGGAIVIDGRLYGGPDGVAGELGHQVVDLDGPICGCGGRGHLEAICSGTGLARRGTEAAQSGASPVLAALLLARGGEGLEGRDVAEAAAAGDPGAGAIVDRAIHAFAAASTGLVNVFNPELIVVGGSMAMGMGDELLGPAREAVARDSFRIPRARVRIVPAALGDDVGLLGAVPLLASRG
jgi:glucokinase